MMFSGRQSPQSPFVDQRQPPDHEDDEIILIDDPEHRPPKVLAPVDASGDKPRPVESKIVTTKSDPSRCAICLGVVASKPQATSYLVCLPCQDLCKNSQSKQRLLKCTCKQTQPYCVRCRLDRAYRLGLVPTTITSTRTSQPTRVSAFKPPGSERRRVTIPVQITGGYTSQAQVVMSTSASHTKLPSTLTFSTASSACAASTTSSGTRILLKSIVKSGCQTWVTIPTSGDAVSGNEKLKNTTSEVSKQSQQQFKQVTLKPGTIITPIQTKICPSTLQTVIKSKGTSGGLVAINRPETGSKTGTFLLLSPLPQVKTQTTVARKSSHYKPIQPMTSKPMLVNLVSSTSSTSNPTIRKPLAIIPTTGIRPGVPLLTNQTVVRSANTNNWTQPQSLLISNQFRPVLIQTNQIDQLGRIANSFNQPTTQTHNSTQLYSQALTINSSVSSTITPVSSQDPSKKRLLEEDSRISELECKKKSIQEFKTPVSSKSPASVSSTPSRPTLPALPAISPISKPIERLQTKPEVVSLSDSTVDSGINSSIGSVDSSFGLFNSNTLKLPEPSSRDFLQKIHQIYRETLGKSWNLDRSQTHRTVSCPVERSANWIFNRMSQYQVEVFEFKRKFSETLDLCSIKGTDLGPCSRLLQNLRDTMQSLDTGDHCNWLDSLILRTAWYSAKRFRQQQQIEPEPLRSQSKLRVWFNADNEMRLEDCEVQANRLLYESISELSYLLYQFEFDEIELSLATVWLLFDGRDSGLLSQIRQLVRHLLLDYQSACYPTSRFRTMNLLFSIVEIDYVSTLFTVQPNNPFSLR